MDLTTKYLGLELRSPLVAASSPVTLDVGNICRLEEAGAGAVVLPSVFQEQIEAADEAEEHAIGEPWPGDADARGHGGLYRVGLDGYLDILRRARAVAGIPVIASLNGRTRAGWVRYAQMLEQAGASAIELNVYFMANDPALSGAEVEARHLEILRAVKAAVSIPVAMKLGPFFSSLASFAQELEQAGAAGLVLFNRFYQPDIDLTAQRLRRELELSRPAETRLPLLWIGLLAGRLNASLAASTGVEGSEEVIKYLLAGADVVMTASALLRHGVSHMRLLASELVGWLEVQRVGSLAEIRGKLSQMRAVEGALYDRANYIGVLQSWRQPR